MGTLGQTAVPPDRRAGRTVLRFVASVLIVSGILMLMDAGTTLLWQEPFSAVAASIEQSRLDDELASADAASAADRAAVGSDLAVVAERARWRARTGHAIGRIELPTIHRSWVMVQGTGTATLQKGPGHYSDTEFPGEGRTVGVAGHRTTFLAPFRNIDRLRPGDRIELRMPYGRFRYAVSRTRKVAPTDVAVLADVGHEQLVLSACHPLYSAAQRIVVTARLVSERPR